MGKRAQCEEEGCAASWLLMPSRGMHCRAHGGGRRLPAEPRIIISIQSQWLRASPLGPTNIPLRERFASLRLASLRRLTLLPELAVLVIVGVRGVGVEALVELLATRLLVRRVLSPYHSHPQALPPSVRRSIPVSCFCRHVSSTLDLRVKSHPRAGWGLSS